MKNPTLRSVIDALFIAVPVLGLARYGGLWLVAVLIYLFVKQNWPAIKERSLAAVLARGEEWLGALGLAVLVAINARLASQILLCGLFMVWWVWRVLIKRPLLKSLVTAAVNQFLALVAIFGAATFWHWSSLITIILAWASSFLAADLLLASTNERARVILAAAWALVVAECTWIFCVWLVNYVLLWFRRDYLIIPQAAVVLTALGYCYGGIYVAHRANKLSRARLVEYLVIGLALLVLVIAGTQWSRIT